jgi:hypothetical protein
VYTPVFKECPQCQGSGREQLRLCAVCAGSGRIPVDVCSDGEHQPRRFPYRQSTTAESGGFLGSLTKLQNRLALPHGRLVALVTTVTLSLLLLMLPVYSSTRTQTDVNGPTIRDTPGLALIEINGLRAFAILAVPVVIALMPMFFSRVKMAAATAMLIFASVAGFSIGLFYVPVALVLAWPERELVRRRGNGN